MQDLTFEIGQPGIAHMYLEHEFIAWSPDSITQTQDYARAVFWTWIHAVVWPKFWMLRVDRDVPP